MKNALQIVVYVFMIAVLSTCNKVDTKETCCDDSAYEENIVDKNIRFFVPNIITPNNDSRNDAFLYSPSYINNPDPNGHSFPSFAVKKLKVYKLSGNSPVFESNDYKNDFTGNTSDGKPLDEGKYRYELLLDSNFFKGDLCIIRSKNICTAGCKAMDMGDQFLLNMSCN